MVKKHLKKENENEDPKEAKKEGDHEEDDMKRKEGDDSEARINALEEQMGEMHEMTKSMNQTLSKIAKNFEGGMMKTYGEDESEEKKKADNGEEDDKDAKKENGDDEEPKEAKKASDADSTGAERDSPDQIPEGENKPGSGEVKMPAAVGEDAFNEGSNVEGDKDDSMMEKMIKKGVEKELKKLGITKSNSTPRPGTYDVAKSAEDLKPVDPGMDIIKRSKAGKLTAAQMNRNIKGMFQKTRDEQLRAVLDQHRGGAI